MVLAETHTFRSPPTGKQPSRRLEYLDSLRGLLLVLMAVNHIPSPLHAVTDHPLGFMSAAEGFVFLSGLMAGLVFTRKLLRDGQAELLRACFSRARSLYVFHIASYFAVFLIIGAAILWSGQLPPNAPLQMAAHPLRALLTGPLLVYQPALLDILPMYCGFIMLVPPLIWACERGLRNWVLGLSISLWALVNAFCPQIPNTLYLSVGAFNMCAWQILFVVGGVFGHAWARGDQIVRVPRGAFLWCILAGCGLLFCVRHAFSPPGIPSTALDWLTNKNNLAPLRLANTAGLFLLVRYAASHHPSLLSWAPLAFLGRASIAAFTAHVIAAYVINANPRFFDASETERWLGTALMLTSMVTAAAVYGRTPMRDATAQRPIHSRLANTA
jgi:hypothetical protein